MAVQRCPAWFWMGPGNSSCWPVGACWPGAWWRPGRCCCAGGSPPGAGDGRGGTRRPSLAVPAVVSWAGPRGVVPLAAALSIPLTTAQGAPLPQRDLVIVLATVVIAVTLVV
jgi:NhaP-type Na+/H+ or K+/H+ antiporter